MSEYATRTTNAQNVILNPLIYWRVSAFALAAVAALGFVVNILFGNNAGIDNVLKFDWVHNTLHVVLAAAAFVFGFAKVPARVVKTFAIVFGFVYAGLGVIGLAMGLDATLLGVLHLQLGVNIVHLLLGAWALTAGFAARY